MHAITLLLSVAVRLRDPEAVRAMLVSEARELFDVTRAVLLSTARGGVSVETVAVSPDSGRRPSPVALTELPALRELLDGGLPALTLEGEAAAELSGALGSTAPAATVMLLPMRPDDAVQHVLVLDGSSRRFSPEDVEVGGAFAAAVSASLAHLRLDEENAAQIARQAALARAAKTLNESLDLNHVLMRICQEAASILDGDNAVVYRGNGTEGLTVEATYGLAAVAIGHRVSPGGGLVGEVAALDRPLVTNDHPSPLSGADRGLFGDVRSCVAVPIRWDGELRGVLAVGYERDQVVTGEQQGLLEALGELAGAACRNASRHSGLAREARTDGLTGCINHSAMHDTLRREIRRCERAGRRLSLVLVDMDDFKQVNEEHGHLAGDEVLRRVGHALRQSVRPYDIVARYGGDEFAIVAVETDERSATEMARRALAGVSAALRELGDARRACGASAGVAEWARGEASTGLIHRADRALLYGKQNGLAGTVVTDSQVPVELGPARIGRRESPPARAGSDDASLDTAGEQIERLRTRARQLARATELGRRVAAMTDPQAIVDAAVDQLHRSFGYFRCAVVRAHEAEYFIESVAGHDPALLPPGEQPGLDPAGTGPIDTCLAERRPVIFADVRNQRDSRSASAAQAARAELVVPLWVGGDLWGAIEVTDPRTHAFDADDACLVQTVADQVGSALYSAMLYERLDRAYVGTAEALATALEAKDSYNASRARKVADCTTAVGRRLGLAEHELRTLRFGAIFHDIGKVAVPERILNKRGPLTDAERREVERHPVVGERILSSVDFLRDVLPLVRHEHERWDGKGYPDGLADEHIPIGARIILACDAYDAMTSDRPYRPAMSDADARAELLAGVGTQFDERVVTALLE